MTRAVTTGLVACIFLIHAGDVLASPPCKKGFEKSEETKIDDAVVMYRHGCEDPPYQAVILEVDLTSDEIDFGTIEGSVYRNAYFGLSTIPPSRMSPGRSRPLSPKRIKRMVSAPWGGRSGRRRSTCGRTSRSGGRCRG